MEIYFLRHGDAGAAEGWKGSDTERPLSKEGFARMEKEAVAIARLRPALDVILTSPLVRAQQTAEIVAKKLGPARAPVLDERLAPGFGAAELRQILEERRAARGVMVVGHEPDFSRVISVCIGGGAVECRKGSLVRVDMEDRASLAGVLVWLLPPRVLVP
jgi:phosphohistidine phosphatase